MAVLDKITGSNRTEQLIGGLENNLTIRSSDYNKAVDVILDHETRLDDIEDGTYTFVDISLSDGTVSDLAIKIGADANNGLYGVSDTQLGFAVEGALVGGFNTTGLFTDVIAEQVGGSGVTIDGLLIKDKAISISGAVTPNAIEIAGTHSGHVLYIHPTSVAAGKRAFRIGDFGTEIETAGGEGLVRTYAKTTTGTGATALQFHWGLNTVAAVDLIGNQMQYESQVAAVGSETLVGSDIIVGIAAAGFMATTAGDLTKGLIGGRFKVYSDVTSTDSGSVAALWLDNQMSSAVVETEVSIRNTTGGSVPDAWASFSTTSAGWDNLFLFDATMVGVEPIITSFAGNGAWDANSKGTFTQQGQLKIKIDATEYYIPFGTVA